MKARSDDLPIHALSVLIRAIARSDLSRVKQLLAEFPQLASEKAKNGATRESAAPYFLDEIGHYIYTGDTALHIAAAAHQASIVRDLIMLGASLSAKNRRGAEPLHYACDGHPGSKHWNPDAQAATLECLLAAGANPNATDRSGVTPLHRAIRTRSAAATRVLLDHGANIQQTNRRGSAPLQLAMRTTGRAGSGSAEARREQEAIVRLLVAHGA